MRRRTTPNPALWVAIAVPIIGMLMTAITVFTAIGSSSGTEEIETGQHALSKTSWRTSP